MPTAPEEMTLKVIAHIHTCLLYTSDAADD